MLEGFKHKEILAPHTSLKIGGPADYFYAAKSVKDFMRTISLTSWHETPFVVIGSGTNILVADEGFRGLVIKFEASGCEFNRNFLIAEGGVLMSRLTTYAAENNFSGLEWAAGLPGTLAGAICGNAGSFGCSIADIIDSVDVFNLESGEIETWGPEKCGFKYRDSLFKHEKKYIILKAVLNLSEGDGEEIREKMKINAGHRMENQPRGSSAGCIFSNVEIKSLPKDFFDYHPEAKGFIESGWISAGWLIDECGLKGTRIGGARVSDEHANFIINTGKATFNDFATLIGLIRGRVSQKFGILLKEEIQYII